MQEEKFDHAGIRQLEDHGFIWLNNNLVESPTGLVHQVVTTHDLVELITISTIRIEDMSTIELEVAV